MIDEATHNVLKRIERLTMDYFGISHRCSLAKHDNVEARQVAMFIAHRVAHISLVDIGQYFKRHHTTVLSAVTRIARAQDVDTRLAVLWIATKACGGDDQLRLPLMFSQRRGEVAHA